MTKINTLRKLGLSNLVRVGRFRMAKRSGRFEKRFPVRAISNTQFDLSHAKPTPIEPDFDIITQADSVLAGKARWYGWYEAQIGFPYDWFVNPFSNKHANHQNLHWSTVPEPHPSGDIKDIWEQSRFTWAVILARAFAMTGNAVYRDGLQTQLNDWLERNPAHGGVHFMCGQETSIRLLNLLEAMDAIGQEADGTLLAFVDTHLERINMGLSYAVGQQNNHATSEAAALAVGGAYGFAHADTVNKGNFASYRRNGMHWLARCCGMLFFSDGGFSQYSITYHRLALDTLVLFACWAERLGDDTLTNGVYADHIRKTSRLALNWLSQVGVRETGAFPTVGSNDGANPYSSEGWEGYRDLRSSLERAAAVLNRPLQLHKSQWVSPDFGIARLSDFANCTHVWLRAANDRFRPSHSDCGHVDLILNGQAVLIDRGTYRYTPGTGERDMDLAAARAHSTLLANDREPMPRLGRFLFGDWLAAPVIQVDDAMIMTADLPDGVRHRRSVQLAKDGGVIISDTLTGASHATLRWQLADTSWTKQSVGGFNNEKIFVDIKSSGFIEYSQVETADRSDYYARLEPCSTLIAQIAASAEKEFTVTTRIRPMT